jgi:hypothetical protein
VFWKAAFQILYSGKAIAELLILSGQSVRKMQAAANFDAGGDSHVAKNRNELWPYKDVDLMKATELGWILLKSAHDIRRSVAIPQKLVDAGPNVRIGNDAALYEVVRNSPFRSQIFWKPLAETLLAHGANVLAQNDRYDFREARRLSMLYTAIQDGNIKLAQFLLDHGANVNGYGWTRYRPVSLQFGLNLGTKYNRILCWRAYLDCYDSIILGSIRSGETAILNTVKYSFDSGADVKTVDTTEACTLIVAAWLRTFRRIPLANMIVDRMLQIRGVDDVAFDENLNDGALKVALYRFDLPEEDYLPPIQKLIRERREIFISQNRDSSSI